MVERLYLMHEAKGQVTADHPASIHFLVSEVVGNSIRRYGWVQDAIVAALSAGCGIALYSNTI